MLLLVVNLRENRAVSPERVGGKAAALAQLVSLHVATPEGFCVTTKAYDDHVTALWASETGNGMSGVSRGQPTLKRENLSDLRNGIMATEIQAELRRDIKEALAVLKQSAHERPLRVAVRSSATTEDGAEASCAGQYDTFLNILDEDGIIDRIKRCWASCWSERACFYRTRKGMDHWNTSMAVLVQELVPAEAAGTLFLANPVTRNDKEAIVEATWGLGELLMSGRVTPDTYVVEIDGDAPALKKKRISKKQRMLVVGTTPEGGIVEILVPEEKRDRQILPDQAILDLVQQGVVLSRFYGHPCDIEWAWVDDHFVMLQARPITFFRTVPW